MPTMNISLPEQLKEFVESEVESGRYTSVSEYIRELVRPRLIARERERLEREMMAGLHSGEPIEMSSEMWAELENELSSH